MKHSKTRWRRKSWRRNSFEKTYDDITAPHRMVESASSIADAAIPYLCVCAGAVGFLVLLGVYRQRIVNTITACILHHPGCWGLINKFALYSGEDKKQEWASWRQFRKLMSMAGKDAALALPASQRSHVFDLELPVSTLWSLPNDPGSGISVMKICLDS